MLRRITLVSLALLSLSGCFRGSSTDYDPPPLTFDGSSDELQNTLIVPTLDTPVPADKNAIWCSTFSLAWKRMGTDVLGGPQVLDGAEETVDRLNNSPSAESDLPDGSFVAMAGRVDEDIVDRVQETMQERFGREPTLPDDVENQALLAYAYLEASVLFDMPFFECEKGIEFRAADGAVSRVAAFGIRHEDEFRYEELRAQVEVLHATRGEPRGLDGNEVTREFIIDPCRTSQPSQLILARVDPRESLVATWDYVADKIEQFPDSEASEYLRTFDEANTLLVPTFHWRTQHRFSELEGQFLQNPGFENLPVSHALQTIHFQLDRCGAKLESEALEAVPCTAPRYHFDRPFLIAMRKRGSERPYFVMWVADAELLCPLE